MRERAPAGREPGRRSTTAASESVEDGTYASYGEALFNLDLASGAFSCARCHTKGWSYGDPGVPGQGAFGWNLTGGSENAHFPNEADLVEFVQTGSEHGVGYAPQARAPGACPAFGTMLTDEQIQAIVEYVRGLLMSRSPRSPASSPSTGSPSSAACSSSSSPSRLFCGSIYLLLATNLGARLGFLVALTGLAGWMTLMGIVWMIYGIGLKGPDPSWKAVPGRTVLQDTDALYQAGVFESRVEIPDGRRRSRRRLTCVADEFRQRGLDPAERGRPGVRPGGRRGRRVPRGDAARSPPASTRPQRVFDIGGERYPKIGDFDLFAFFHKPHYVVVEVAPLVPMRTEPGRAPPPAEVDDTRQRQYVYMVRDLGARRQPADRAHGRGRADLPDRLLAAAPTRPRARPTTAAPASYPRVA